MAIEKLVSLQLKVARPRDGQALAEAARDAAKVDQSLRAAGASGSKALADASASARTFQAETQRSAAAVTNLSRELGKAQKESVAVTRVTDQLRAMGIEAGRARAEAQRLMSQIGTGARVAEQDVRRLASAIRATPAVRGGAGATGAPSGLMSGNLMARFALPALGAGLLQSGGQAAQRALATPIDEQINAQVRRESPWSSFFGDTGRGIPLVGSVAGGLADVATHGPRAAASEGQRRFQENMRNQEADRQRRALRTTGALSAQDIGRQGARQEAGEQLTGQAGLRAAGERASNLMAERRFDRMAERFADEIERAGRGEGVGRTGTGAVGDIRGEVSRRPEFGTAERFRIAQERAMAQQDIAAAQAQAARPEHEIRAAGQDVGQVRADAQNQLIAARQRLVELAQRDVEVTRQAAEAEGQRLERFRQFAQQAEQTYRNIAQHEGQRIRSFREQFGMMDETGRMEVQQLSRRAAADQGRGIQRLSSDELRTLQGTGLFEEQVRGETSRRGDLAGAQEIIQASGAQQRVEQAEQRQREAANVRVQLENQITVNANVSAQDVATQVNAQLVPLVKQLMLEMAARAAQQTEAAITEQGRQIALQNAQGRT